MRRGSVLLLMMNAALLALATLLWMRLWVRDRSGSLAVPQEACGEQTPDCTKNGTRVALPAAIRFGPATHSVSIALFIDLRSVRSRQIFQRLTRALRAGPPGQASELLLLHSPGICDGGRGEQGCQAARAVECVERLAPGVGVQAVGVAFDRQWQPERDLLASMAALGVDISALRRCVVEELDVDARLAAHAEAARRHGLGAAPAGLVIVEGTPPRIAPFGAWLTEGALRRLTQCLVDGRCQGEP